MPKSEAKSRGGFNILERGATQNAAVREVLVRNSKQFYRPITGDPNKARLIIPIPEFPLAYALRSRGLVSGTALQLIGPEGVGKTTLIFTMIGWGMRYNCPAWYGETENKLLEDSRLERCLHWDRGIAKKMLAAVHLEPVREIVHCWEMMNAWLIAIRDPGNTGAYVPLEIPAMMAIDTWSKLMSPAEAAGFLNYEKVSLTPEAERRKREAEKKKSFKTKIKEKHYAKAKAEADEIRKVLGSGSNFSHAKLAHEMSRQLAHLLGSQNAFLILGQHENDQVDMNSGGGSFVPADVKALYNPKTIGGRGFRQSAALQLVLAKKGFEMADVDKVKTKVGLKLFANVNKNTFGPLNQCDFRLSMVPRLDTESTQEMALNFDAGLVDALNACGMRVTLAKKNDITCEALNLKNASLAQLAEAFYSKPELMEKLMRDGGFAGCDKVKFPELNPAFLASLARADTPEPVEEEPEPVEGGGIVGAPPVKS